MTKEQEKHTSETIEQKKNKHELILINDDVHTFDYVIDALIEICDHTFEQAHQCAMITHLKGQCDVKRGNFDVLKSMRRALIDRELKAKIN